MFNPTPEQDRIFAHLRSREANLLVDAKAGTGKTTTIVEGLKVLPERNPATFLPYRTTFLAFNKAIAETLKSKCPRLVSCSTFHSLGFRTLKDHGMKPEVVPNKVMKIIWKMTDREHPDQKMIQRLVGIAKGCCIGMPDRLALQDLADFYAIEFEERDSFEISERVLAASDLDEETIDFDDMLRFPVRRNLPFQTQDNVFVDEAQDTNPIQVEIVERLMGPETRLCAVGDPNQAIYGFRGATSNAMDVIQTRFTCKVLPLSVTWRCPKKVVDLAQQYLQPIQL